MRIVNTIPYAESPDCKRVLVPCNTNFVLALNKGKGKGFP